MLSRRLRWMQHLPKGVVVAAVVEAVAAAVVAAAEAGVVAAVAEAAEAQ